MCDHSGDNLCLRDASGPQSRFFIFRNLFNVHLQTIRVPLVMREGIEILFVTRTVLSYAKALSKRKTSKALLSLSINLVI